jgi:hypothetical protein
LFRLCHSLLKRSAQSRLNRLGCEGFSAQNLEKNPDARTERSWETPVVHHDSFVPDNWLHIAGLS